MNPFLKVLVVVLSLSIMIFGCDKDNPVDEDNHDEHAEAVGLVIFQSGGEIGNALNVWRNLIEKENLDLELGKSLAFVKNKLSAS